MADAVRTEETTRYIVHTLQTPTNWVEVSKTLSMIRNELAGTAEYDDTVTVSVREDQIRFTFDAKLLKYGPA